MCSRPHFCSPSFGLAAVAMCSLSRGRVPSLRCSVGTLLLTAFSILPPIPYTPVRWSTKMALAHTSLHPVPPTTSSYNCEDLFIFLQGHAAFPEGLASVLCLIWSPCAGNSLKFLVFGWHLSSAPFLAASVLLFVCFFHDFSWIWAEEGKVANFCFQACISPWSY